jgi:pyridinium-3,5-bisthiocarboxylic acid mononucleotide nickel chelatase
VRIAHVDCAAGASGDMFLGAWLDLGIDEATFRSILEGLHVPGYKLERHDVFRSGIRACKVDVIIEDEEPFYDGDQNREVNRSQFKMKHSHPHRHLPEVYDILDNSALPDVVREKSKQAFRALAEAEGAVHGMPPEEVHFHEVGAIDAIVDIVGAMTGWFLAGMPACYVTPIEVGMGTVKCAHGVMPVPVPAAVALLKGFPTYSSGVMGETVTPTGAAIIKTLCQPGSLPVMTCDSFGYGAGQAERSLANILRIRVGEEAQFQRGEVSFSTDVVPGTIQEPACVLESNLDDMTPEWSAYVITKLMDLGAMDAWMTPIMMKKGRAATQLQVLCAPADKKKFVEAILRETSTLGVRYYSVEKSMWKRSFQTVKTTYGPIRIKLATDESGIVVNAAPEYEDCRTRAQEHGVPLKEVYRAAICAAGSMMES